MLFGNNEEQKSEQGQSLFDKAAGVFSSVNRFMKSMWWSLIDGALSHLFSFVIHVNLCFLKLILETLQLVSIL